MLRHLRAHFELLEEQVCGAVELSAFAALQRETCIWIRLLYEPIVPVAEQRVGGCLDEQRHFTRRVRRVDGNEAQALFAQPLHGLACVAPNHSLAPRCPSEMQFTTGESIRHVKHDSEPRRCPRGPDTGA